MTGASESEFSLKAIWKTAPILVVLSLSVVTAVVILTGKLFL